MAKVADVEVEVWIVIMTGDTVKTKNRISVWINSNTYFLSNHEHPVDFERHSHGFLAILIEMFNLTDKKKTNTF